METYWDNYIDSIQAPSQHIPDKVWGPANTSTEHDLCMMMSSALLKNNRAPPELAAFLCKAQDKDANVRPGGKNFSIKLSGDLESALRHYVVKACAESGSEICDLPNILKQAEQVIQERGDDLDAIVRELDRMIKGDEYIQRMNAITHAKQFHYTSPSPSWCNMGATEQEKLKHVASRIAHRWSQDTNSFLDRCVDPNAYVEFAMNSEHEHPTIIIHGHPESAVRHFALRRFLKSSKSAMSMPKYLALAETCIAMSNSPEQAVSDILKLDSSTI